MFGDRGPGNMSLHSEMGMFDLLPPSAKRSKQVNRHSEASESPVQSQYVENFWENVLPEPCEESCRCESMNMFSTTPAGMVSRYNGKTVYLTHEQLPRPSQLMGKKRHERKHERHAAIVLQHIGDLRKKQSHINELKGDTWWGNTVVSRPEDNVVPKELKEAGNDQSLGLFSFREFEQLLDLAPGGNPMMSFVEGTAHRSPMMVDEAPACATENSWASGGILRSDDLMSYFQNRII